MESITSNKFITQFKLFANYYNNSRFTSEDVHIGQCPQLKKPIPANKHYHNKKYFITLIVDWYINYYEWLEKINVKKVKVLTREALKVAEKSTESSEIVQEETEDSVANETLDSEREVPDSWDI